jgi:hypothetical protein
MTLREPPLTTFFLQLTVELIVTRIRYVCVAVATVIKDATGIKNRNSKDFLTTRCTELLSTLHVNIGQNASRYASAAAVKCSYLELVELLSLSKDIRIELPKLEK